jgi:O-antigen/teichoic acid export membrane protein
VQSVVQVAALVTGLIIVRAIGKDDYAYYTVANGWVFALVNLSNSGVGDAATAIGGRVWQDPARLGRVVATAMRLRRWLTMATVGPVVVILVWTLHAAGCDSGTTAILAILVAAAGICQITYGLWLIVPRLQGDIRRLQYLDIFGAALRLGGTAAAAAIFIDARIAMLISLVTFAAQTLLLRYWLLSGVNLRGPLDLDVRREMTRIVARQWPNEVNGVFQGQISILLLSFFGMASSVADLGALTRIGMLFIVSGSVMGSIILPRYARCQDARRMRRLYVEILAGYLCLALVPVVAAIIVPQPILWLLGPQYRDLSAELVLVAINTALMSLVGVTWGLNTIRGWILPWWLAVPIGWGTQLAAIAVIGAASLRQVLFVAMCYAVVVMLTNIAATLFFTRGFTRVNPPKAAFVAGSHSGP